MIRTHKIALVPNNEQESLLRQHAGYARFAWNWALNRHVEERRREGGEWLNDKALRPLFNAAKDDVAPWCRALSQNAAKNAIIDFGKALDRWGEYRKQTKAGKRPRRVGHPRHRRKHRHCSYQADNGPGTVAVRERRIVLPKIGAVRMRERLRFDGSVRKVVVKHDGRRWFACVSVECDRPPFEPPETEACGVDVGVTHLASIVTSDGELIRVENPRPLAAALRDLRRIDKAIARSKKAHDPDKTSNRRRRLYEQRKRVHARIRNVRADHRHKTTTATAKRCGVLAVETLNVSGMMRNRRLARSLADAGVGGWLAMLEAKSEQHGRRFERVDRWYPSSKTCSNCRHVADLKLSERVYRCSECGHEDDRDYNAAKNLLAQVAPKRGDDIRPDCPGSQAASMKRKHSRLRDPHRSRNEAISL